MFVVTSEPVKKINCTLTVPGRIEICRAGLSGIIHSLPECLLGVYHDPGTVVGAGDKTLSERNFALRCQRVGQQVMAKGTELLRFATGERRSRWGRGIAEEGILGGKERVAQKEQNAGDPKLSLTKSGG